MTKRNEQNFCQSCASRHPAVRVKLQLLISHTVDTLHEITNLNENKGLVTAARTPVATHAESTGYYLRCPRCGQYWGLDDTCTVNLANRP